MTGCPRSSGSSFVVRPTRALRIASHSRRSDKTRPDAIGPIGVAAHGPLSRSSNDATRRATLESVVRAMLPIFYLNTDLVLYLSQRFNVSFYLFSTTDGQGSGRDERPAVYASDWSYR